MYVCKNGSKILNELPMRGSRINSKAMVGMILDVEYKGIIYEGIKILEYSREKDDMARFKIEYNGHIFPKKVPCCSFLKGGFGNILGAGHSYTCCYTRVNTSVNQFELKNNILYIYGHSDKYGSWTALYSGNYIEEVMKLSWSITINNNNKIKCVWAFNCKEKHKQLLHRIDFKNTPSSLVIDHINNNPLDNRKENLRVVTQSENLKNKNHDNPYGLTGLQKSNTGWHSSFLYKNNLIYTKVRHKLEDAKIDNLIAQHYLGYKHNEDMFYILKKLPNDKINEVTNFLDKKMTYYDNKKHTLKEYIYDIEQCDNYYILNKNGTSMLLDCDLEFIKNKRIWKNNSYWVTTFIEDGHKVNNSFHKELLGLRANEYKEYNINIDHLNNNPNDNRCCNLIITSSYGNQCNKQGVGYTKKKDGRCVVQYMRKYRYFNELIGGLRTPTFQREQEAITEVERRKHIIEKARVKLYNKQEVDTLIKYCFDSGYTKMDGNIKIADLDLGYLYLKNILN